MLLRDRPHDQNEAAGGDRQCDQNETDRGDRPRDQDGLDGWLDIGVLLGTRRATTTAFSKSDDTMIASEGATLLL